MTILKVFISFICLIAGLGLADWLKENAPNNLPTWARVILAITSLELTICWIAFWA